jgi:hypothetical protein
MASALADRLGGVHALLMGGQLLLQRLDPLAQGIGPGAFGGGHSLGLDRSPFSVCGRRGRRRRSGARCCLYRFCPFRQRR